MSPWFLFSHCLCTKKGKEVREMILLRSGDPGETSCSQNAANKKGGILLHTSCKQEMLLLYFILHLSSLVYSNYTKLFMCNLFVFLMTQTLNISQMKVVVIYKLFLSCIAQELIKFCFQVSRRHLAPHCEI